MIRTKGERDLNDVTSNAISFRCWTDDEWLGPSNLLAPGVGEYDSVGLPTKFCPGGIRSNIFFPSYVPGSRYRFRGANRSVHCRYLQVLEWKGLG